MRGKKIFNFCGLWIEKKNKKCNAFFYVCLAHTKTLSLRQASSFASRSGNDPNSPRLPSAGSELLIHDRCILYHGNCVHLVSRKKILPPITERSGGHNLCIISFLNNAIFSRELPKADMPLVRVCFSACTAIVSRQCYENIYLFSPGSCFADQLCLCIFIMLLCIVCLFISHLFARLDIVLHQLIWKNVLA